MEDGSRCDAWREPNKHLCPDHLKVYYRQRYRRLQAEIGKSVYGIEERAAEAELLRYEVEQWGPPEDSVRS